MSQYNNQNQIPGRSCWRSSGEAGGGRGCGRWPHHQMAYPPPASATAYVAPPPIGYPTRDGQKPAQNAVPIETKTRGDGFWKGCCAALCCCCVLDACF